MDKVNHTIKRHTVQLDWISFQQESDLKSYGEKEVRRIEHASKSFQKMVVG